MFSSGLIRPSILMLSLLTTGCALQPAVFVPTEPSPVVEKVQRQIALLSDLSVIAEPAELDLGSLIEPPNVITEEKVIKTEEGMASWYGPRFHGRKTANGERFDMHELTAAHRKLPFNSLARVTCLSTGEQVVVRINDRGPYAKNRTLDLSKAAAEKLGMLNRGVTKVKIEVLASNL